MLALYEEAFPQEEKKPWELLVALAEQGKMELLAVAEKGEFIGLVMNMLSGRTALLDYFSIVPKYRSCGYGGCVIGELLKRFRNQKYIFEIEMQDANAENAVDRRRRKAFYLRNGLKETGLFVNVYATDFELLTPDGELTFQEYTDTLEAILGEEGIRTLNPRMIADRNA